MMRRKEFELNILSLKNDLDHLLSMINEPKGVVPEWTSPGVSDEELRDVERIIGFDLPSEVKDVCRVFDGFFHEVPVLRKKNLAPIFQKVSEKMKDLDDGEFNELVVVDVMNVGDWGRGGSVELKNINKEAISYLDVEEKFFLGIDENIFMSDGFVIIGATYSDSLYINLNEGEDFGSIYNSVSLCSGFVIYKVAENFIDLFVKIKDCLMRDVGGDG